MQKNKLIILSIGSIILIILVGMMIFLERDDRTNPSAPQSNIAVSDNNSNEAEVQNNSDGSSINNQTDQDSSIDQNNESLNNIDETDVKVKEVREKVAEAIKTHELNETATEMTKETLYAHSLLNQNLSQDFRKMKDDESFTNEDDVKQNAEWTAIELMGWHDHATDNYQFNYSEQRFLAFIEDQNLLEEEDIMTSVLLEQLKNTNNNVYIRQLEILYLKPFIWDSIEDEVASNMSNDFSDLEEEEEQYQVFLAFDQEVISNLVEKHPNLFEGE